MTNLEEKFAAFELQATTQHTELMEALNTIAYALGAPPTAPTVTLANVVAAITAGNTARAAQHIALMASLGLLYTNTDIIINNNSLNAQKLIAAIYATFCECETDTPLLAPPLDIIPTSLVDEAKCRRIQFYLSIFGNWLDKIANYGNTGANLTGGTIAGLLQIAAVDAGIFATGLEVGAVGGPPGIVLAAVLGLIAIAIYAFGGSVLVDYANQFNDPTLRDNMVQALYLATNADEGYEAFNTTLFASMDAIPAEIIKALWWSAWSNDIYSGTPEVDDSAFDGSICGPPPGEDTFPPTVGCVTLNSVTTVLSNGQTLQCIAWPDGGTVSPAGASGAGVDLTANQTIFGSSSIAGMWAVSTPQCHVYWEANGNPNFDVPTYYVQLPATGGNYYTFLRGDTTPFSVTICVEEPA